MGKITRPFLFKKLKKNKNMGCLITSGRKVPCKSAVGGIKTIYFADYGTLGDATIVAGEITGSIRNSNVVSV